MILTSKNIHECASYKGVGFTRQQLKLLGVKWPPKGGWLKKLIGTELPDKIYDEVKRLGDERRNKLAATAFHKRKQGAGKFHPISTKKMDVDLIEQLQARITQLEYDVAHWKSVANYYRSYTYR